ncbi:MarR family transcriptional regulator [Actinacidiphila sp. DG2A-62]|jgi:DNA-binding MarR family transcriptional regulator|uniref:MarR family winged helix-turn-helix transcriptional regulator n=1 Tax=Actinacidiphila sp. DG2A-62 TaxID=3108821 RepID=UPI002DBFDE1B|nr:MarR family transcriptional regulator [Actinacidiphila sp. DG2A-62]MEC3998712.1 MarR family transcriptional regulator [Actinacidiphila sp. DG2A-62]
MPQERGEGSGERDGAQGEDGARGEPEYDPAVWTALARLSQLASAVSRGRLTERAADAAGLSLDRPAISVLLTLHTAHKPLRIGEIATRMQVVGPHVTRQVQILERRGLVRRVADPDDRRASLVEPTEQGAGAAERYMASMIGWFMRAMGDWPDKDREELGRLLGRFADDVMESLALLDDGPAAGGR